MRRTWQFDCLTFNFFLFFFSFLFGFLLSLTLSLFQQIIISFRFLIEVNMNRVQDGVNEMYKLKYVDDARD